MPPLDVAVCSYWQHVDGPAGGRPHCTCYPVLCYILDKVLKTGHGGIVTEPLKHGRDVSFW